MAKDSKIIRNIFGVSVVWAILVSIFLWNNTQSKISVELEETSLELNLTLMNLELSRNINQELERMIKEYIRNTSSISRQNQGVLDQIETRITDMVTNYEIQESQPDLEYEQLRRRIRKNIQEMSNYVESEIHRNTDGHRSPEARKRAYQFLDLSLEHKRSLLNDMDDTVRVFRCLSFGS